MNEHKPMVIVIGLRSGLVQTLVRAMEDLQISESKSKFVQKFRKVSLYVCFQELVDVAVIRVQTWTSRRCWTLARRELWLLSPNALRHYIAIEWGSGFLSIPTNAD